MTSMPLFLDREYKLEFKKLAMPVKLSDAPDAWQREIAAEIYKQVPFLADYAVNVIIDRVDPEKGFAFGSAHVTNKSHMPEPDQQAELPSVRIPLIVKERMLLPMDVMMDGQGVFPLSETRLREKLFNTNSFETSTRKPSDRGIVDQLYPPLRTNYGMGSATGDAMGMGKTASLPAEMARRSAVARTKAEANANPSWVMGKDAAGLLDQIAPTIPDSEADQFVDEIASDKALSVAAAGNETFQKLAMKIASAKRHSVEKTAAALVDSIRPTVVQFTKLASGDFLVKWANAGMFAPQQDTVGPEQASSMAGTDLSGMQAGATVTVGTEKAQKNALKEDAFQEISEPGVYKVHNADSQEEMVGHVMPVTSFEMQPLELLVFTTEGAYAVQDEIAGIRQSDPQPPPAMVPLQNAHGDGAFVYDVAGKLHCLPPVTVHNLAQTPNGVEVHVETMFGEQLTLMVAPGLQAVQHIDESTFAIPDFVQWHPFQGQTVFLAKKPIDVEQVQAGQAAPTAVDVGSTGPGEFSMEGQPLSKVAAAQRYFLKQAEAEFLLVGMGLDPFTARDVLAKAETKGHTKVAGLRPIIPLAYVHRQSMQKAASILSDFPYDLRRNLVKEAAALEDSDTADKILALNFLNPENVAIFAGHLPHLDTASQKLAEMLVASRLGMSQVDEGAVERAMKNLEQVIEGLKALQQKQLL